jgi:hypothetical protein
MTGDSVVDSAYTVGFGTDSQPEYIIMKLLREHQFSHEYGRAANLKFNCNHYQLAKMFKDTEQTYMLNQHLILDYPHGVVQFMNVNHDTPSKRRSYEYLVRYVGEKPEEFDKLLAVLNPFIIVGNYIQWVFKSANGLQFVNTELKGRGDVKDSYYPFIPDAQSYMDEYLKSHSSIMILNGHRGTGKSSLISNFISRNNLTTMTTYDQEVMKDDYFFIRFLTEDYDLMVLEDADLLLLSRLEHNNATIAKLLNVSDGIIDMTSKKIIITANLENKRDIDPAIMRPGRCHSVIDFRKLIGNEVDIACADMGKDRPGDENEYSLAECFNGIEKDYTMKMGFNP